MLKKLHFETRIKLKSYENKRKRKPKGQSRMDNPGTLATCGTQDTERRTNKTRTHETTTQKTKQTSNTDPAKKPV